MEAYEEIKKLLDRIFVFEPEFRAQILDKAKEGIDGARLEKLKKILESAIKWQTGVVARKIQEDKTFLRKISAQRKKIGQDVINQRARALKENDLKKMQTILLKIKNI